MEEICVEDLDEGFVGLDCILKWVLVWGHQWEVD